MSTFGEELRRERELRKISLREVSEATKINLRYLDALERNDFRHLPGGVFNKGFVRAYAQFIGVDPETMVNAYLLEEQAQEQQRLPQTEDVLRGSPRSGRAKLSTTSDSTEASARKSPGNKMLLLVAGLSVGLLTTAGLAFVWQLGPNDAATGIAPGPGPEEIAGLGPQQTEPVTRETTTGPSTRELQTERSPVASDPSPAQPLRSEQTATPVRAEPPPVVGAPDQPEEESGAAGDRQIIQARVILERATSGSLNCDNRRVEVLDGLPAGTVLDIECRRFLLLDAEDGGGLRLGLSGSTPAALVADGVPLRGYRIVPAAREPNSRKRTRS